MPIMDLTDWILARDLDDSFPLSRTEPFSTAAAVAAGLTRHELTALVTEGLLRRPIRGVYLSTAAGDSLALRIAALRLVVPDDCVVVDGHAGWLLGAEMTLAPGEHLSLRPVSMFRPSGSGRVRAELASSGERWLPDRHVTEIGGLRVTTPVRTAWDLGRTRSPGRALAGIDQMLRLKMFGLDEFVAGIEQFRGQRWVTTLRAVGPLGDWRAESPPESILRLMFLENLFPLTPQTVVLDGDRFVARLDLGDEDLRAAAEYDGAEWHSDPDQLAHDRARRKDARQQGYLIEVFTKEDVFDARGRGADEKIVCLRRQALARRGRRPSA
jgi:hypothetical protein